MLKPLFLKLQLTNELHNEKTSNGHPPTCHFTVSVLVIFSLM